VAWAARESCCVERESAQAQPPLPSSQGMTSFVGARELVQIGRGGQSAARAEITESGAASASRKQKCWRRGLFASCNLQQLSLAPKGFE
jgi:hypothetical protein